MRLVAILIGGVLLLVAVRGTEIDSAPGASDDKGLWPLLKNDFEPGQQGNFLAWTVAILVLGAIGYIPELETLSTVFIALLILVLVMSAVKGNPNLLQNAASEVIQKVG
jgi:hypothetical protein